MNNNELLSSDRKRTLAQQFSARMKDEHSNTPI
jgi:hypothetical protein